ncbi:Ig-like V-type domain-containing protein FAM187A [Betta splendens]|uniref:Ig-like V-type domain-containing protein FAM187A n=1 Tax=Betta splendens TaxID=158456 RepID=A0A6P7N2F9_BETSP|nr:Ig-like V-type domain-containing protein FAM187A [Betta splendens]
MLSPVSSPLVLLLLWPSACSYEAPEETQDVFATRACPAFLTFTNAAHLAGATVELPCHCKPHQVQSVVWFFKKHLGHSAETKALTDYHGNKVLDTSHIPHSADLRSRFSIRLFSLLIFRAAPGDSGIYMCGSAHKDFFYGYDLDIQEAHMLRSSSRLKTQDMRNRAASAGLAQPLYEVFTRFQPWSVCNRCGVAGEQVRVGLCYLQSNYLHVRYRRANQTVASCGSRAVPRAFVHLEQRRVEATLEVRSCTVTCPPPDPRPSRLDSLMTFLGYSSASRPSAVPVFYVNHPADSSLALGCPGAQSSMAVAWDRGSKPIYQTAANLSIIGARIVIDAGHHLLFRPAQTQDSGVYYCWLQGRRAAEIHLLVYAHLGRSQSVTSHPDFQKAVLTVLQSFAIMTAVFCLLVFVKAGVRHLRDNGEIYMD